MKYIDEYRDPEVARALLKGIEIRAKSIDKQITIMEVCGSHTYAIGHSGIRDLLPENVRLVSGPGCPVCVTSIQEVDKALYLAGLDKVIFATFGDMMRVPGSIGMSLQDIRAMGSDVRIVSSPLECLNLSKAHMDKEIIFMGIGFETTSPAIASVVMTLEKQLIKNVSIFSVHKVIPPAIKVLLDDPVLSINGFICPGHVSVIIGSRPYEVISQKNCAAVITGFEPLDILEGIYMILGQILNNAFKVEIQYTRAVKPEGNVRALELIDEVFMPIDSIWRGLGSIPGSGLMLREDYAAFDALRRFDIPEIKSKEVKGCCCGEILRGVITPKECPLYKTACTPTNPIGPCMVSSEGTCAAYYKYH